MLFGRSSRSKTLPTERLPEAVALDSASETIAPGVCLNKSEDLSISERIWVTRTLNDFIASFNTGAQPLEDAWEDVSLVIQARPVHGGPTWVPSVGTQGKEPVIESAHELGLSSRP